MVQQTALWSGLVSYKESFIKNFNVSFFLFSAQTILHLIKNSLLKFKYMKQFKTLYVYKLYVCFNTKNPLNPHISTKEKPFLRNWV